MEETYIHLDVLFRQMQPEIVLRNLISSYPYPALKQEVPQVDTRSISEECYRRTARGLPYMRERSEDELIQRYRDLNEWLAGKPRGGIFSLLAEYGAKMLRFYQGEPLCRHESILEWRRRTLYLGQDVIVCAAMAARDVREHRVSENFAWPPAVSCDHFQMQKMLEEGMAENHFHLNGSTQIFPLAWGYLMNDPGGARSYFADEKFRDNLQSSASFGVRDNVESWEDRIQYAAWIRETLFCQAVGQVSDGDLQGEFLKFRSQIGRLGDLKRRINTLKYRAAKLSQSDQRRRCLDYAITPEVIKHNEGPYRFLAGERHFLYQCFCRCFRGECSQAEQDLFYLYLLIKRCMREELVQVNGRMGFRNFSDYQSRKGQGWGASNAYSEEAFRLSIAGALVKPDGKRGNIHSLELRIMPEDTDKLLEKTIRGIDGAAEFALNNTELRRGPRQRAMGNERRTDWLLKGWAYYQRAEDQEEYFYVIHFAKEPMKPVSDRQLKSGLCQPRNHKVREKATRRAKAMARALEQSSHICSRIRGIDACSHEIGCRPETFATAFRYLRQFTPRPAFRIGFPRYWPRLGLTYHVGEDFLCIADGLRAIDEAVCFLNMERGDRLGHGLALGTDPEQYYKIKGHCVFLPAQDLLDNLVWIVHRSQEWNVEISPELRVLLEEEARRLLRGIYGEGYYADAGEKTYLPLDLKDYYDSWKLRGDDPEIYQRIADSREQFQAAVVSRQNHRNDYERAKLDDRILEHSGKEHYVGLGAWLGTAPERSGAAADIRCDWKLRQLMYDYHFNVQVRKRGEKICRFQVSPAYVSLMREMQDRMMEKLMERGIAIECNPSSNVLIGTFGAYEKHPIFRFNHSGLALPRVRDGAPQLAVSVNTDDQGVFDTLLENEYGLLFGGLQSIMDCEGKRMLDDDSIYAYLKHLREMGNQMTFPKAVKGS